MNDKLRKVITVIQTPSFFIPSAIIFVGVTWFFYNNYDPSVSTGPTDALGYWLMYLACTILLQVTIYMNIRKIVEREEQSKHKKR